MVVFRHNICKVPQIMPNNEKFDEWQDKDR